MHFVFVPKLLDQSLLCQHTQHLRICISMHTRADIDTHTFVHRLVCSYRWPPPPLRITDTFKYETHNCEARANANQKKALQNLSFFLFYFFCIIAFWFFVSVATIAVAIAAVGAAADQRRRRRRRCCAASASSSSWARYKSFQLSLERVTVKTWNVYSGNSIFIASSLTEFRIENDVLVLPLLLSFAVAIPIVVVFAVVAVRTVTSFFLRS